MRLRYLIGIWLILAAAGAVVGSAASLSLSARSLGAVTLATPRCTTAALNVLPVLSGSTVSSVTIATLPAACGGATLKVTVNTGVTTGSGSIAVPAGGGSTTVPIAGGPALTASTAIDAILEGP
jgi:hypothetical protein